MSFELHDRPDENRKETRQRHDSEWMIDGYIRVHEELDSGIPLAS